jgi:hypothetical protein
MKHGEARDLPPCAMSTHCLRLADALDGLVDDEDDLQDQLLLAQLRTHIPTCSTCKTVLSQARRQRNQQRAALQAILREGEERVPSTVFRIQEALRREPERGGSAKKAAQQPIPIAALRQPQRGAKTAYDLQGPLQQNRRVVLRNVVAVAVAAALILAAVGLFNHRLFLNTTTGKSHQSGHSLGNTATPHATQGNAETSFDGWNAAMMAVPDAPGGGRAVTVQNYNFAHNSLSNAGGSLLPPKTQFDGISPDGSDLLYQRSQSGSIFFFRLLHPFGNTGYFFELPDQDAENAIWMSDSRNILIGSFNSGIIKVDTLTGQASAILPHVDAVQLVFYHNDYVYYMDQNASFSRVNITTGAVTTLTAPTANTTFWYSPDATKIYWSNFAVVGQAGIYVMNVDGTGQHLLRSSGTPVGFAADNSLLIMRYTGGQFQVIKLGETAQQDHIMVMNAAPGATSLCPISMPEPHLICDNYVAMAPYGHALIVQGTDADGTYHVWSDNLITHAQTALHPTPNPQIAVQLLGWDRVFAS